MSPGLNEKDYLATLHGLWESGLAQGPAAVAELSTWRSSPDGISARLGEAAPRGPR